MNYCNKKSGVKNKLSNDEKKYFEKLLSNKYKVLGQLGRSGSRSSVYMLKGVNKEKYVMKISNSSDNTEWIISQKEASCKINSIFDKYKGDVKIPKYVKIGKNFVVEKYLGEELTYKLYDSLCDEEKDKIATDLAIFLCYLHQKDPQDSIGKLYQLDKPTLEEVYDYINNYLVEEKRNDLRKKIEMFNKRDKEDEIIVITHADIRSQNLLYDKQTKSLAVIDFELLSAKNIYHDFVPFAAASFNLPYQLLYKMIDYYNEISNYKVDVSKVKLFHELGIIHEYVRCAMYRKEARKNLPKVVSMIDKAISNLQ